MKIRRVNFQKAMAEYADHAEGEFYYSYSLYKVPDFRRLASEYAKFHGWVEFFSETMRVWLLVNPNDTSQRRYHSIFLGPSAEEVEVNNSFYRYVTMSPTDWPKRFKECDWVAENLSGKEQEDVDIWNIEQWEHMESWARLGIIKWGDEV